VCIHCFTDGGGHVVIKPGYYKTRDGRSARVVCVDAPIDEFPVIGFVENRFCTWKANGAYGDFGDEFKTDLVEPGVEPKKLVPHWPALISDGEGGYLIDLELHDTVENARKHFHKHPSRIERLLTEYPPIMLEATE
jgi:hypothetical protein